MSQQVEKVPNFLAPPPSARMFWTFLNLGKKFKFDNPPPSDLIWEKCEIGKFLNFGNPPQKRNISLKHLKLPKNHFKTNLFFVNLKHLRHIYIWEKNENIASPPLLSKSQNFEFWTFLVKGWFWVKGSNDNEYKHISNTNIDKLGNCRLWSSEKLPDSQSQDFMGLKTL